MTERQVKLASDYGFEIGSHGLSHLPMTDLDHKRVRSELRDSKSYLEDLIGREVPFFAYPYGKHDPNVAEQVYRAGYRAAFLSRKKTRLNLDPPLDRFELPKDWMMNNLTFKGAVGSIDDPKTPD